MCKERVPLPSNQPLRPPFCVGSGRARSHLEYNHREILLALLALSFFFACSSSCGSTRVFKIHFYFSHILCERRNLMKKIHVKMNTRRGKKVQKVQGEFRGDCVRGEIELAHFSRKMAVVMVCLKGWGHAPCAFSFLLRRRRCV